MLDWTPLDLEENLDSGKNVFLKLWKPGCGACKLSEPALERVEAEFSSSLDLVFAQINAEEFPEMLETADTDVLPCFFVFKDQELKAKLIGFKGIAKLTSLIEDHFD